MISADLLRQPNRIAARTAPWPWAWPTASMARSCQAWAAAMDWTPSAVTDPPCNCFGKHLPGNGSFTVHAWHSGLVASWHYAPHPVFLTLLTTTLEVGKTAARHRPHTTAAPIWAPIQRQWAAKHGGLFRKNAGYSKRTQRRWASFFSSAMRRLALSCFCSSCMRSRSVTLPSSLICSS